MTGRYWRGAVALLSLLSASSQLQAQGTRIFLGGGVGIPLGSYDDVVKMGWEGTAGVAFQPRSFPLGIQVDGSYAQFSDETAFDIKNQLIYGTANARYQFASSSSFRPYLVGGVGVYNSKAKGDDAFDDSSTKSGANLGAGFDFGTAGTGLFLEARYHSVFVEGENLKFLPITLGIRFGG
jgi:opacity protein-like surface antigen